jgi:hypothetical protein
MAGEVMDPTANLKEQREVAAEILAIWDRCTPSGKFTTQQLHELQYAAHRLAELVQALDEWVGRGGFLPEQWQRGRG